MLSPIRLNLLLKIPMPKIVNSLLVIAVALMCSSCAFKFQPPWNPDLAYDTTEKVMMGSYVALNVADVYTTDKALTLGAVEINPFFGENPRNNTIIISKAVVLAFQWSLMPYLNHTQRKWFLGLTNAVMGGVVINNLFVLDRYNEHN